MGLDIYASRTEGEIFLTSEDIQAFSDANIDLCGGLFSGDPGSFRGKMYDLLLLDITGVSPLQAWIPPEIVRVMYIALASCDLAKLLEYYEQIAEDNDRDYTGDRLEDLDVKILELRKFFRVCAKRGLGLIGDY